MYQSQSILLNINKDTRDSNVTLHDPNYKTSLNETFGYPKSDFEIMTRDNNSSNEEQILSDSIRKISRIKNKIDYTLHTLKYHLLNYPQ